MATANSSDNRDDVSILTALQQGVLAVNNLTQTMKTIFPSSS